MQVFISYRRADAAGHAGRLYDALASRLGDEMVAVDIDTIELGEDFRSVIERTLADADAVIAVIGREWLDSPDALGRRRLDNPDDFVRLELETALQLNIPVIPVLVQGAKMPAANELPAGLAALAHRQALELSDVRWRNDVDVLVKAIEDMDRQRVAQTPGLRDEEPDGIAAALPPVHAFVSYSSEDHSQVFTLVGRLRELSVPIWIDDSDIDAALLWGEVIVEAIERCAAFVVMLSQAAVVSSNVVRELVLASEYKKPILPLLLEPVEVPRSMRYQLAGIQHIELFKHDEEESLRRVARSLHRVGLLPDLTSKSLGN